MYSYCLQKLDSAVSKSKVHYVKSKAMLAATKLVTGVRFTKESLASERLHQVLSDRYWDWLFLLESQYCWRLQVMGYGLLSLLTICLLILKFIKFDAV
jgi:hypothetical protein